MSTGRNEEKRIGPKSPTRRGCIRRLTRRRFLAALAACAGARALPAAPPRYEVLERRTITRRSHVYHGWPTLARRRNGELLLAVSGGREAHVCPFGRVELLRSKDGGKTWSWPQVLLDSPIDDRDSGVVETNRGTILVTTFTSLAYEPILERAIREGPSPAWPRERIERWRACHERVDAAGRRKALGVWMLRSTDGGVTWSAPYDPLVNSPHGPIQLADGRLLYAGKDLWRGGRVGFAVSADDGVTWKWLADLPVREGDRSADYHELHAVETEPGRIICHLRNHNRRNRLETLQSESADGGRTWSPPHAIGVWGLPSHLLRLRDGRLLMSYGHRRPPYGVQCRLSADGGRSWSEALVISGDGHSGDLGYPSTVELDGGTLLTVWYELPAGSPRAVLRQARWRLAD